MQILLKRYQRILDKKAKSGEEGFTLVELMVVLGIISILTAAVVINVAPVLGGGKVTRAKSDIATLSQGLEQYNFDMGEYPSEDYGLDALRNVPGDARTPDAYRTGGYIKNLPNDPWGLPYIYVYPGENGVFDLISYGADGEPGGEDLDADIVSWQP